MQEDLFEFTQPVSAPAKIEKLAFLEKTRISIRLDQVLTGMIALLVLYVFVFSDRKSTRLNSSH